MNWAYVAGFFDGEGSVGMHSKPTDGYQSYRLFVQIAQKSTGVLHQIQAFLAAQGIGAGTFVHRPSRTHQLTLTGDSAFNFLSGVLPYLVVKKTITQDAVRLRRLFPPLTVQQQAMAGLRRRMRGK